MALSIGIVGLPNVGKSTLFNAITCSQVDAANYPFCTIEPNVGVVKVPDNRLEKIAEISKPAKIIHATIEFTDIAGLVKDAHKGEGLGNKFLSHIRECQAICEIVRAFEDPNIVHVEGKIDPTSDRETINLELIFADLETINHRLERVGKDAKRGDKEAIKEQTSLEKFKNQLESGQGIRKLTLTSEENLLAKNLNLLTVKPIIYVLNVKDTSQKIPDTSSWDGQTIIINAQLEAEIARLPENEQAEFLTEMGITESGLNHLIRTAYDLLGLQSFFTTGSDETRAWTIKKGAKAPQAAGEIHGDFEKAFIRAEVINWQDFVNTGSELAAREQGLMRLEGKEYIVADGDICNFRVGV